MEIFSFLRPNSASMSSFCFFVLNSAFSAFFEFFCFCFFGYCSTQDHLNLKEMVELSAFFIFLFLFLFFGQVLKVTICMIAHNILKISCDLLALTVCWFTGSQNILLKLQMHREEQVITLLLEPLIILKALLGCSVLLNIQPA